jgi:uncharacterized membrane protein YphA (DoxX/SURF4 family)
MSAGAEPGRVRQLLESAPVQILARLALAAIFFWAALPKIGAPAQFARDIANYRLLPGVLVHPTVIALPWIELLAAALLVLGIWTRAAALVCTLLLLAFTGALVLAIQRGLNIECGCFGQVESGGAIGWTTVARDGAFLVPALLVLFFDRGRYGPGALFRRGA